MPIEGSSSGVERACIMGGRRKTHHQDMARLQNRCQASFKLDTGSRGSGASKSDTRTEALLVGVLFAFVGVFYGQQGQNRCKNRHVRMLQCCEVTCID